MDLTFFSNVITPILHLDTTFFINVITPILQLLLGGLVVYYLNRIDQKQKDTIKLGNYAKQLYYAITPTAIALRTLLSNTKLAQEYMQKGLTPNLIQKCEEHQLLSLTYIDTTLKNEDSQLWKKLDNHFISLPILEYELLFKYFTVSRFSINALLTNNLNLENKQVQAVLKQGLMYTDCVTAYLNYLTEESNKKYCQYLPLPKPFKFRNKYKDVYDKSYTELTNQNAKKAT